MIRVRFHLEYGDACNKASFQKKDRGDWIPLDASEKSVVMQAYWLVLDPLLNNGLLDPIHLLDKFNRDSILALESREQVEALRLPFRIYGRYLIEKKRFEKFKELYLWLSERSLLEPLRWELHAVVQDYLQDIPDRVQSLTNGSYALLNGLSDVPNRETGFRYSYLLKYRNCRNDS